MAALSNDKGRRGSSSRAAKARASGAESDARASALRLWADFSRERGLNTSKVRDAIVEIFLETEAHVTIDELLLATRARLPAAGWATVYRTLKLLEEAGIAHASEFHGKGTRYEVTIGRAHHDHMVCRSCGRIFEFENDEIERLQESIAKRAGFRLESHRLELYGVCKGCAKEG